MDKHYEKYPIEEKRYTTEAQNKIEVEGEQIRQLLKNEQKTNPEYRECLEKLSHEFERRVAKANMLVQELSEKMEQFDWFIVPPVMSRTDYGYATDIDLVIIHDSDIQPPEYNNEVDGVFMIPTFVSKERFAKIESKYPEVTEWYKKKLGEDKPGGKSEKSTC